MISSLSSTKDNLDEVLVTGSLRTIGSTVPLRRGGARGWSPTLPEVIELSEGIEEIEEMDTGVALAIVVVVEGPVADVVVGLEVVFKDEMLMLLTELMMVGVVHTGMVGML